MPIIMLFWMVDLRILDEVQHLGMRLFLPLADFKLYCALIVWNATRNIFSDVPYLKWQNKTEMNQNMDLNILDGSYHLLESELAVMAFVIGTRSNWESLLPAVKWSMARLCKDWLTWCQYNMTRDAQTLAYGSREILAIIPPYRMTRPVHGE